MSHTGAKESRRVSCESCYKSKKRCGGGRPCDRCRSRGEPCMFSSTALLSTGACSCHQVVALSRPRVNRSVNEIAAGNIKFGRGECLFFDLFNRFVNTCVGPSIIRRSFTVQYDAPQASLHASQAFVWAGVAIGAAIHRSDQAKHYLDLAKQHLQLCYDTPSEATIYALLMVAHASVFVESRGKSTYYVGLALAIFIEVRESLKLSSRKIHSLRLFLKKMMGICRSESAFVTQMIPAVNELLDSYSKSIPEDCVSISHDLLTPTLEPELEPVEQAFRTCHQVIAESHLAGICATPAITKYHDVCGTVASNPVVMSRLGLRKHALAYLIGASGQLNQLGAASAAAEKMLDMYETDPLLMYSHRKAATARHRIRILEMLLPQKRFGARIEGLLQSAPITDMPCMLEDPQATDMEEALTRQLMNVVVKPMVELPLPSDGCWSPVV